MEIIEAKTVVIRKEFPCHGCNYKFPVKSIVRKITCVDQEEFYHYALCEVCQTYYNECMDGDVIEEGALQGVDEYWDELKKEFENGQAETD